MRFSNKYGTVDLLELLPNFYEHKDIGINLSGGTDSALLLYQLCHIVKEDQTIVPMTLIDIDRPTNIMNAYEIVAWMKERFPHVNFGYHHTEEWQRGEPGTPEHDKRYWHNKFSKRMRDEKNFTMKFHARTANPPYEEAKKHDLLDLRETVRDPENGLVAEVSRGFCAPYIPVDKRWVAQVYKDEDIMDLFEITASCISRGEQNDWFTKSCRTCWWCREKLWSFGCYDYGEKP